MRLRASILIIVTALGLAQRATAQPVASPTIHRVTLQPEAGVLTITGTALGPHLLVAVDGQPVTVLPGATDTRVDVQASTTLVTTPGTYRLMVFDPARQVGDAFAVATAGLSVVSMGGIHDSSREPAATTTLAKRASIASRTDRVTHDPDAAAVSPNLVEGPTNTAVGLNALASNTTGAFNTAAGAAALGLNTSGSNSTATGYLALGNNTTGTGNTAEGASALRFNTTGSFNVASGSFALHFNTAGNQNTAFGASALESNTTGSNNTASGDVALYSNTTGSNNTATGMTALVSNTTGVSNTASGVSALGSNTTGFNNTASGVNALLWNTTGFDNTATGVRALLTNTSGTLNAAHGGDALSANTTGHSNTAVGFQALSLNTDGDLNIAVGLGAGRQVTTGSYNVFLGANVIGTATDANTMRLGLPYDSGTGVGQNRTFIAGIHGTVLTGPAVPVFVDVNGQLGTLTPPIVTGSIGAPLGASARPTTDQHAVIAELRERVARLEALVQTLTRRR